MIGLASNVALTVGKGVGGLMWGSASLLADAVHSMLDLIGDFVTLFTFRKARANRDEIFPYGYGKLEPLGALTISGLLLFGGAGTGYHSFEMLRETLLGVEPHIHAHSHSHGITDGLAGAVDPSLTIMAFALISASIVVKEGLFWATMRVAKKTGSDVLVANAWHHRADSVSSLVALAGVGGAVAGFPWLDPIGGILVSGMIVQASIGMLLPAVRELADSAPKNIITKATDVLTEMKKNDANIIQFNTVRARKMGPDHLVDLQLQVNPRISVSQSHQISENVRHAIMRQVPRVTEVLIHIDVEEHDHSEKPVSTPLATSQIEQEIRQKAMEGFEDEVETISHLSVHFLASGMEVVAEILPARATEISFQQAADLSRRFQQKLMKIEGVVAADVHLETTPHNEK
ncbi:hypothetical protein HDU96_007244 [Phlyctochytrium bullatum]|nr:hypothetical protein HDU96_007244 [Phlyctochytrium bullatum]